MYSLLRNEYEKKTAKGIAQSHIRQLDMQYRECLMKKQQKIAESNMIRSYGHQVYSQIIS